MQQRILRFCAAALMVSAGAFAASHRNGPLLLEDQTANLNDFYIFRSYETGNSNNLVMSMSVQGFQNPDNGPSYYKFSDSVLYRFNINNSARPGWKSGHAGRFRLQHHASPEPDVPRLTSDRSRPSTAREFCSTRPTPSSCANLDTRLRRTIYNTDMNGHALSVAPPNQGPKVHAQI